jgi:hypothetical protein
MRKLTASLLAGAAVSAAAAAAVTIASTSASATTNPALIAGTYYTQEVTTSSCDGRAPGLDQSSVFNFAGFGKVGNYENTGSTASVPGNFPAIGYTTFSTAIPTGVSSTPGATTNWVTTEALYEEGDLFGSYLDTHLYTVSETNNLMFIDKNTALATTEDATGCAASVTYIRVGK